MELNRTYNIDCVKGMKNIKDETIDMAITSPPYDDMRQYKGYTWNFEEVAKELYRILKKGGVLVWVVKDRTVKGSETLTSFRQAIYFSEIGFNVHDTMIWEKTGMLPTQDRYYDVFDYMFILSKGKPKTMNFICDKANISGGRKQKKDLCINKGENKKGNGFFVRKEFGRRTNIWRIPIGKNKETEGHPAPFPEQLAEDHIITWSGVGDLILDPFMGSGTTAKVCLKTKRNYIGFEISKEYCEIERRRTMKERERMSYIEVECERQWNECQAEQYGRWENQSDAVKNEYRKDMEQYLCKTGRFEEVGD